MIMIKTYLDVFPNCDGCPVSQSCGTMVSSVLLCNSYKDTKTKEK